MTGIPAESVDACKAALADALFSTVPAGVGSQGTLAVDERTMDDILTGGARWAVQQGY